jgi:hypothetical protein
MCEHFSSAMRLPMQAPKPFEANSAAAGKATSTRAGVAFVLLHEQQ